MRRAVRVVVAGGVAALFAAGCGSAPSPGPVSPAAPTAAPETKATCEAVGEAYTKNIGPFAEALTAMVQPNATAASRATAQRKLRALADSLRGATQSSGDARLRSDGKQAADQLQARSADAKFFGTIKTTHDVDTVLGPSLKQWLSPVTHHCS
ncbi:hypothetical protein ODJ79_42935 [Actinoplanes sp. KI2]|uniref:hypothetical protein n=1 Tax=Actinoplanes sp. KI2 TaxID=2983315 RepID=UPI0021D56B79|nr:hypothetical protein [Actinoplanes sp. KI2]MCU7730513.1 hypothetical protein [Actinoplanes sp. KI2]